MSLSSPLTETPKEAPTEVAGASPAWGHEALEPVTATSTVPCPANQGSQPKSLLQQVRNLPQRDRSK